ncbi:hypothetical protein BH09VER1_BH09VER1_41910 [soil metagenome]
MINHWTTAWNEKIIPLARRQRILLACDFDGTVAPIAATPHDAKLPENTHALLRKLSSCEGITLAFVSGRELADLKSKVNLEGVTYCGNHGMEIETPDLYWENSEALSYRPNLSSAIDQLKRQSADMEGVLIEDKRFTASVHWRLASPDDREQLRASVRDVLKLHPDLRLTYGKAVWEIRPPVASNKGTALSFLLRKTELAAVDAVFLGDDHTDESAFQALEEGFTIRVGTVSDTKARFRAENVADAAGLLFCLYVARNGEPAEYATTPFPEMFSEAELASPRSGF